MPDKGSPSKKAVYKIRQFERVVLRAIEAVDRITSRLLLYALTLWEAYQYFIGKH